ncbi:PRC-barrel domain-containing protein [Streptomyces sp. NPDC004065]|uniref:PRC-barrel domain-containing protein n=1 Tax=Streptomyces sp. NPDC004065 TaxID=3364689 RepID=UPI0038512AFE
MFEAQDVRQWRGHPVHGADGSKIGELEAIYVDTITDQPFFATVKTGMLGRQRLAFVPLTGATVSPGHLNVAFDKKVVKDAPSIDTDGELLVEGEPAVFEHYGLAYKAGSAGERRLARR